MGQAFTVRRFELAALAHPALAALVHPCTSERILPEGVNDRRFSDTAGLEIYRHNRSSFGRYQA